jgi:hypothetical protein
MNPFGALVMGLLSVLVLCLSRAGAAVAVIASVCYLTEGQDFEIAGFRLTAIRVVLAIALLRVLARGELKRVRMNSVDWALICYAVALLLISTLRVGTVQELVYRVGMFGNVALAFFVCSALLQDPADVPVVITRSAWLLVPYAMLMVLESFTGRNLFGLLGGVYSESWIRDGHVRSAGAFRNAITAGSFGATFALLFATRWFAFGRSLAACVGLIAALAVVVTARSSGPFLGLVFGLTALACWPVRLHTRKIRWGIVLTLAGLAVVMKAPIWFLLDRVSDATGGGGYHRALLIDRFVNDFGAWWLAGTSDTKAWFPYSLDDGTADITNRFVLDGVDAGIVGLTLSVALVVRCFQRLGTGLRIVRGKSLRDEKVLWGLGATLIANVAILFSVTYFDQMFVVWYFLLACIARVETVPEREQPTVTMPSPRVSSRVQFGRAAPRPRTPNRGLVPPPRLR